MLAGINLLTLTISHVAAGFTMYLFTSLDDNSYCAASVATLLDETIAALESGEPAFVDRLKRFRESQRLSYENRFHLLENSRQFQANGEAIRKQ
jgi:hypothetical protein